MSRGRPTAARSRPAGSSRRAGGPPRRPARKPARRRGEPVYRLRRFPRLPWRLKAALGLGWVAAAALALAFAPTWPGRVGLLLLATAALPLVVVLVRDPSRRTR